MKTDILWSGDPAIRAAWEQLLDWLDPKPGDSILDVGCGKGEAIAFAAGRVGLDGCVVGLDTSPEDLRKVQERFAAGRPPLQLVRGTGQDLPFRDVSFDAVLCVNVLEAIPDRLRALSELRRVLKLGGRLVLAHGDYESMVYAGADRDLTRKAVRAYADSTFASYLTSDGQMGRHLRGLCTRAGFAEAQVQVIPIVNVEYRAPLLGWTLSQFGAGFVSAVSDLSQAEIDGWHTALTEASSRGEFVFCLNLYVCVGHKSS